VALTEPPRSHTPRALAAPLAVLAFPCGAVALRHEHARAECFGDAAEISLDPEKCGG
jgi:hypothetical protein